MGKYTGTVQSPGLAARQNQNQWRRVMVRLVKNVYEACLFSINWRGLLREILSPPKFLELHRLKVSDQITYFPEGKSEITYKLLGSVPGLTG